MKRIKTFCSLLSVLFYSSSELFASENKMVADSIYHRNLCLYETGNRHSLVASMNSKLLKADSHGNRVILNISEYFLIEQNAVRHSRVRENSIQFICCAISESHQFHAMSPINHVHKSPESTSTN